MLYLFRGGNEKRNRHPGRARRIRLKDWDPVALRRLGVGPGRSAPYIAPQFAEKKTGKAQQAHACGQERVWLKAHVIVLSNFLD